jgi:hypothetical protein
LAINCSGVPPVSSFPRLPQPAGQGWLHEIPGRVTPHSALPLSGFTFTTLISLAVTLIVIGVLLWLVNTYIPMDGKIKKILNVVVVICVVVWLLFAFGILNHSGDIRVPRVQ